MPNPPSPTTVAVIDGGFIPHRAFQDGLLLSGYDFIKDAECAGDGDGYDNGPTEVLNHQSKKGNPWHGTAVTGIIAGTFKSYALELQKNIKILPIRFLTSSCSGTDEDLTNALKGAAGMPVVGVPLNPFPAKIINLAIGVRKRSSDCDNLRAIFHELYERNITVIAGAGNNATPAHWFRFANCPEVMQSKLCQSATEPEIICKPCYLVKGRPSSDNLITSNTLYRAYALFPARKGKMHRPHWVALSWVLMIWTRMV